ncbi:MAG: ABC transporter ATP-binding protein [Aquabacterium sp.]|uniref:ABC transporter ATP-binding protein n=1 Tax=Aquabacterium sp. TaxID=1872578 RepID=UPI0025C425F0|nr:ABC transporter ATP-binding protein [Aquabacterium sp.]MBI3383317.1 ABC transporter ATP-binding protein [Aquabacterium sp.]
MSHISFSGVKQVFAGGVLALDGVTLDVQAGEFVCLLGPSGCGKSTLLHIAAGFHSPTQGTVSVNGQAVQGISPQRLMVFQEYALFPWMTVEDNVMFGLKQTRVPNQEARQRVRDMLAFLRLSEFAGRYPKELSGGMKQRVAIARAMVLKPPILLMDEPFAALDALTRRTLQDEVLKLWKGAGTTVLFVTHSIEEALHLGSRVVVLTHRPGTIKADIPLDFSYPRNTGSAPYLELKAQIESLVMAEQQRFIQSETAH